MIINDYEKVLLGFMIKQPETAKKIIIELEERRFGSKPHSLIYQSIGNCIVNGKTIDSFTIAQQLGEDLADCGGMEYINDLPALVDHIGFSDWETLVKKIDDAGRLRELSKLHNEYTLDFKNLEGLVDKVEDVDEYIQKYATSLEGISQKVDTNYLHISNAVNGAKELVQRGYATDIIPCGWPSLAGYMIPRPRSLGIVAGISSMGKTQWCLQLGYGVAVFLKQNNLPGVVSINSMETSGKNLVLRMAYMMAGLNSVKIRSGDFSQLEEDRLFKELDIISKLPIYFNDSPDITTSQFVVHATVQGIIYKRILGISDYIELFNDRADSEELRVSRAVRNVRRVSWKTDSCEILISQFNNSVLNTLDKIGGMHKARYSGAIGQAADWFVEIWNPIQLIAANLKPASIPEGLKDDRAYAFIEKNKDYHLGKVPFMWVPEYMRFSDMSLPLGSVYNFEAAELVDEW